jgi:hypothetical protein
MIFNPERALKNAKECCGHFELPFQNEVQKLTVNDFWTKEELDKF